MKNKKSTEIEVHQFFENLNHPLSETIRAIRELFLECGPKIGEHIKWNSPAFYYKGQMSDFDPKEYKRDLAVINLKNHNFILIIFPTGSKIPESTELSDVNYSDGRKIIKLTQMDEVLSKKSSLEKTIKVWLSMVE